MNKDIHIITVEGGLAAGVAGHAVIGARLVMHRGHDETSQAFKARAVAAAEPGEFVVIGGLPL